MQHFSILKRILGAISTTLAVLIVFSVLTLRSPLPPQEKINSFIKDSSEAKLPIRAPSFNDIYPSTTMPVHGWIPAAAMKDGIQKLELKAGLYASVSPVFYTLDTKGVVIIDKDHIEAISKITKQSNTKLIPSIASFDAEGFSTVLSDNVKLNDHVNFILNEVETHQFDGFDLDYELIYLKDKERFFFFVERLNKELHARNKLLSITVLSQWGDDIVYEYAPQTRKVQNYAELSKYADMFRVMTYDYTGSGNTEPGPIAPIDWVNQVLEYTVANVPKEKVILGIPMYNYLWDIATKKPASSLEYDHIYKTINYNKTATVSYDTKVQEGIIQYVSVNDNKTYKGYYASPETINARIDVAKKFGVSGVSFWRIGKDPF